MPLGRALLATFFLTAGCSGNLTAFSGPGSEVSDTSDPTTLDTADGESGPGLLLLSESSCQNPCTFRADSALAPARVAYRADGWAIGESRNADSGFSVTYDFHTLGDRYVEAEAFDESGRSLGVAGAWVNVWEGGTDASALPDVPYFYQQANTLYPSASCQNTVIAMVLAWRGWSGTPDDITEFWGKDRAQTPAGLSQVLTEEAAYWGLDVSSSPRTNATLSDLRALLDRGLPVPVHGYFTDYGHVVLVLGYDEDGYWVNDPAGRWNEIMRGGYPYGWEPTIGDGIYYSKRAFEAAVATSDGWTSLPMWLHELRL